MQRNSDSYRPEIDGLRALAVIPVILFHADVKLFSGGYAGVDVFFVISGYLITRLLLKEISSGHFSYSSFYRRRARRILPALFTVMLFCLPVAWLVLLPQDMADFGESLIAVSVFLSNVYFHGESGYFAVSTHFQPLNHTWSLAVEEQYYILFPILLSLLLRKGRKNLVVVLTCICCISLILSEWRIRHAPDSAYYLLQYRAWELLMGALLVFVSPLFDNGRSGVKRFLLLSQLASMTGIVLILGTVLLYSDSTAFPGLSALPPTLGAAAVILFATPGTWVHRILSTRYLVAIGLVSYSAYLWHQPIFAFIRHSQQQSPSIQLMLMASLCTFIPAYLSWKYVELPVRHGRKIRPSLFVPACCVIAAGFVVAGGYAYSSDGVKNRFTGAVKQAIDTAAHSPNRKECHTDSDDALKQTTPCQYFNSSPSWAVIGDSHAVELAYALALALENEGDGVQQHSLTACALNYAPQHDDECSIWTERSVRQILQVPSIKNVVVSLRTTAPMHGTHRGVYPQFPAYNTDDGRASIWHSLITLMNVFIEQGKNVVFVIQAPEVRKDIHYLLREISLGESTPVSIPRQWWNQRIRYITDRLSDLDESVRIIDPADKFCDSVNCYAVLDGESLYFDDHHMSVAGASRIANLILEKVTSTPEAHGQ